MPKNKETMKHKSKGSSGHSYYTMDLCVSMSRHRSKSKASGSHKTKAKASQ